MELLSILKQTNTTIIDVREPYEFKFGHVPGAINIPLSSLLYRLEEIRQMQGPIVAYCRSGSRSGQARLLLQSQGIQDVYNGGGLEDMEYLLAKAKRAAA